MRSMKNVITMSGKAHLLFELQYAHAKRLIYTPDVDQIVTIGRIFYEMITSEPR